jgi:Arc/MetJ-type ribon-helix-helix transcriptional regulator
MLTMQLSDDLEALVKKRLASGAFESAEEVIRQALETQEAEAQWTELERLELDRKIDRARAQVESGQVYSREAALAKLDALRRTHLGNREK